MKKVNYFCQQLAQTVETGYEDPTTNICLFIFTWLSMFLLPLKVLRFPLDSLIIQKAFFKQI